ncbi:MAG: hypothetical protein J0I99_13965 [Devosia sp.]|uniref:hypothetical protein n=1 Tax=Devosia sp. TaxID=1871048 RepID=UPI001AD00E2A|nr:hypothetical protein [Devosia sp.]MBN9311087.1 hypothetical protein [Devosia sp.]MBN9316843.1 hypothetical protein [Devosia sp.]
MRAAAILRGGGVATLIAVAAPASAQELDRPDVQDLVLGAGADAQPGPFREYACGTDGGPASIAVAGFDEFARCPKESGTGLHEIAFRYDDEIEYYALAMNLKPVADRYGGTRFGSFPVIVSALFDDSGILRGYRVVTDDRGTVRERRIAYAMGVFAKAQFKSGQWTCSSEPLGEGETPLGNQFVKEDCSTTMPGGQTAKLRVRLLHRPGQAAVDPFTGEKRVGQYESTARLEVFDAGWGSER